MTYIVKKTICPKLNFSKYTITFLSGFLTGIFFGNLFAVNIYPLIILFIIFLLLFILFWRKSNKYIFICLLSLFLALLYASHWNLSQSRVLESTSNKNTTITGEVVSRTENSNNTQDVIINSQDAKLIFIAPSYPIINYGDKLMVEGEIIVNKDVQTNKEFNYNKYLFRKGIHGQIKNPKKIEIISSGGNYLVKKINATGNIFKEKINSVLSEPYSSLQIGLIFGGKTIISDSLLSAFNRTGMTHIIAVSGYNITIILSVIALILAMISRKASFIGTIIFILFFIILTGAVAPVIRAGILAGINTLGKTCGRKIYPPIIILFTINIFLLFNPFMLLNDISFQLSFLAFIGLVFLSPIISQIKFVSLLPKTISIVFSETMGAQIFVLPIIIYNFGTLSIVAPLVNVLILPIIPFTMGMGFFVIFMGFISVKISSILVLINYLLLKYIIMVVEYFSKFNFSTISINTNEWWWIPIYYLFIIIISKKIEIISGDADENY